MREFYQAAGRVEGGRLQIDRFAFNKAIQRWNGKDVYVRVGLDKGTRSDRANAFLWVAIYGPIAEHTGNDEEDIHAVCKGMFLPKAVAFADGNGEVVGEFVVGGSTTRLTPDEFSAYIRKIKTWALDKLQFVIPDDGEPWR